MPLSQIERYSPSYKVGLTEAQVQERLDDVNAVVQENVTGSRVVKAYTQEDYESDRFNEANFKLTETSLKVQKMMAFLKSIWHLSSKPV